MLQSTTTVLSAGVDWITCSAPEGRQGNLLREYGIELLMRDAQQGNRVGPFHRGVYYGGSTKHIGVGEHGGRTLVEISGALANDEYPELLQLADRVSRIDIQVSVRQEPYDKMLALRAWSKSAVRASQEGRPPDYDLYARRSKGSTLYIGEGASRFRARLYERWFKEPCDENRDVWRYEVQARRERALQVAGLIPPGDEATAWSEAFVHQHFASRGVPPIFDAGATVSLSPLPAPVTDRDKAIKWLAHSVRPVMNRLDGWGALDQALRVLGVETSAADERPAHGMYDD